MSRSTPILVMVTLLLATGGCDETAEGERVAQVAQEAAARQAEQNQELARVNREVAAGTRHLVEADSRARQEIIAAQQDLARQQAEVGRQRDQLEMERQSLATERRRESLLVPVISTLGLLLLCCLPLSLAWYLLRAWQSESPDEVMLGQLLIEELVSPRPLLLAPPVSPPAIGQPDAPVRLPGPSESPADADDKLA